MKVEVAVPGKLQARVYDILPSPESDARSVRPGLPVPNKPGGFCGRKGTLKQIDKKGLWQLVYYGGWSAEYMNV